MSIQLDNTKYLQFLENKKNQYLQEEQQVEPRIEWGDVVGIAKGYSEDLAREVAGMESNPFAAAKKILELGGLERDFRRSSILSSAARYLLDKR